ncbi:MAG: hypothetical protein JNM19_05575 [Chitinophagaceae bacterium]|nr:hypothetical protein [Chitinophagaceae bacterium]
MRSFKLIDFFLQIILILISIVSMIAGNAETLNPGLFILTLGLFQIISLLVNVAVGPQTWKKAAWRKLHLIGIGLVILLIIIALTQSSAARTGDKDDKYSMAGLETMIYALIPAILLCLFYTVITYVEWKKIKTGK